MLHFLRMIKAHKQTNIILLLKLLILSFIFCLPMTPANLEQVSNSSNISASKIHSMMMPSNVHFEHKVLKKIPLLESTLPATPVYINLHFTVFSNTIPDYTHSKTSHFIASSFARGPPLHS